MGVPRYSGVADIVRGYPALNNGKQVTAALSDVAISLLGEGDVADTGYARVGLLGWRLISCQYSLVPRRSPNDQLGGAV